MTFQNLHSHSFSRFNQPFAWFHYDQTVNRHGGPDHRRLQFGDDPGLEHTVRNFEPASDEVDPVGASDGFTGKLSFELQVGGVLDGPSCAGEQV